MSPGAQRRTRRHGPAPHQNCCHYAALHVSLYRRREYNRVRALHVATAGAMRTLPEIERRTRLQASLHGADAHSLLAAAAWSDSQLMSLSMTAPASGSLKSSWYAPSHGTNVLSALLAASTRRFTCAIENVIHV